VVADQTVEKDHGHLVARFLARCPGVVAWCPGVSRKHLSRFGFEPARDLADGLQRARRRVLASVARPDVILFPRPQRALIAPTNAGAVP
jgi:hypothetical protein